MLCSVASCIRLCIYVYLYLNVFKMHRVVVVVIVFDFTVRFRFRQRALIHIDGVTEGASVAGNNFELVHFD